MPDPVESGADRRLHSFPGGGRAVVIGASGGLGRALTQALRGAGGFADVAAYSRAGANALDVTSDSAIAAAAATLAADRRPIRLVLIASGFLHGDGFAPERSWREIDPAHMARAFAVNAIGPALVMKRFLPLLPRDGKSVVAALSARVASIGDNRLGGWHSYRASKAALNQIVRTAAIELRRSRPEAICVALHPGTVATPLSAPFVKAGLDLQTPEQAAACILTTIDGLNAADTGGFFDHHGKVVPW